MRLLMTHTRLGCDDPQGLRCRAYDAGQTYEIGATLARQFLESNVADPAPANAAVSRPRRIEPADERRTVGATMLPVPVDPMRRALADRLLGARSEGGPLMREIVETPHGDVGSCGRTGIDQGSDSSCRTGIDQGSDSPGRRDTGAETPPSSGPARINPYR